MRKTRRAVITSLFGLAALSGCERSQPVAATPGAPPPPSPPGPDGPPLEGLDLTPVRVAPSREIRTITGLRPFRPSGFVVRREDRDGKIIVHNYGHGGGGVTLSWGSSHLAVREAGEVENRAVAVVGGGVMGLSTARLLQLRGARVTIYTQNLPPDTVSNVAGAQWWPVSVYDNSRRTDAFNAQFLEAARFSHRYFQTFVGPKYGVRWLPNYYLSDGPPLNGWMGGPEGVLHDLQVEFRDFGPGEHVFPANYARRFYTMLIEPSVYLPALLNDFLTAGGTVVIRRFETADEIFALPQTILFNCTGIGAGRLFNDPEITPIKGQLTFLLPQPEVNYNIISDSIYMFPRADGILLGGTYEIGQWDPAVNPSAKQNILAGMQRLFDGMRRIQSENGVRRG